MSIPVAQNGVTRPAVRDEVKDLANLLPIAPEAKARIRILVVDDEYLLRESCAQVLRHEGYEVTLCGRGEEALDLVKRSEEHTSELQSHSDLVCRLLLEKKKKNRKKMKHEKANSYNKD